MVLRKIIYILPAVLMVSCQSGNSSAPAESTPEDKPADPMETAKTLYIQNCAACHGEDGKLGVAGAKDLTKTTLNESAVIEQIKNGKNGMPPMGKLLGSEENIQAVATYIYQFRKK